MAVCKNWPHASRHLKRHPWKDSRKTKGAGKAAGCLSKRKRMPEVEQEGEKRKKKKGD